MNQHNTHVLFGNIVRATRVSHKRGNPFAEQQMARHIAGLASKNNTDLARAAQVNTEHLLHENLED